MSKSIKRWISDKTQKTYKLIVLLVKDRVRNAVLEKVKNHQALSDDDIIFNYSSNTLDLSSSSADLWIWTGSTLDLNEKDLIMVRILGSFGSWKPGSHGRKE